LHSLDRALKSESPRVTLGKFDRNDKVLVAKIMMLKNYQTMRAGSHLFLSSYRFPGKML
jgi:hypothetical protein